MSANQLVSLQIQRKKIYKQANASATQGEPSEPMDPTVMVLSVLHDFHLPPHLDGNLPLLIVATYFHPS